MFHLFLIALFSTITSSCSRSDALGPPTDALVAQSTSFKRKVGADRLAEWESMKESFSLTLKKNAGDKKRLNSVCQAWLGSPEPEALKKCESAIVWPLSPQPIAGDVVAYELNANNGFEQHLVVDFRDVSNPLVGVLAADTTPPEKTPHDFISEDEKVIARGLKAVDVNLGGGSLDGRYKQGYSVVLEGPAVTPENMVKLQKLSTLVTLRLAGSAVSDSILAYVSNHTYLASITLEKTSVTDVGLSHLHGVRALKFLTIEESRTTGEGVDALKKALPHCEVEFQPGK